MEKKFFFNLLNYEAWFSLSENLPSHRMVYLVGASVPRLWSLWV